jgi:hypothetical protein
MGRRGLLLEDGGLGCMDMSESDLAGRREEMVVDEEKARI